MNTKPFKKKLNNIKFLDLMISEDNEQEKYLKTKFVNTCDAMIHARKWGEMFGIALGEFSFRNKPIITTYGHDNMHIEIIGNRGYIYNNAQEFRNIILNFKKEPEKDWNVYKQYSPEKVMAIFKKEFIDT